MKRCCPSEEILQEFLEGTLEEESGRPIREHLDECPACHETFRKTERLFAKLGEIPLLEPSADFTSRIMEKILPPVNVGAIAWRSYIPASLSLFAASFILIVLGLRPYFAGSPFILSRKGSEALHRASALFFNAWETGKVITGKLSLLFSSAGKIFLGAGWQIPCLFFVSYILMGGLCLWMLWNYSMRKPAGQRTPMSSN